MNKAVIIGAVLIVGAYIGGYAVAENGYLNDIIELKSQLKDKQDSINSLTVDLATKMAETKIVFRDIETEVIKYVETTDTVNCFDDNAIKLYNKAASGH